MYLVSFLMAWNRIHFERSFNFCCCFWFYSLLSKHKNQRSIHRENHILLGKFWGFWTILRNNQTAWCANVYEFYSKIPKKPGKTECVKIPITFDLSFSSNYATVISAMPLEFFKAAQNQLVIMVWEFFRFLWASFLAILLMHVSTWTH